MSNAPTPHQSQFSIGQTLNDRYQVVSLLGTGGMGLVYRVKQIFVNRDFAFKTIAKAFHSENTLRRFQQEARAAFALDHPNIVSVKDFGVLEDGTPFLVMELIEGKTLGETLKKNGRMEFDFALPIFLQVCKGLSYAHKQGVVHRDIKPTNIMLLKPEAGSNEIRVKLVDFGIAKFVSHEEGEIQALTRTGEIFGSPIYMSPEQCIGAKVDCRADIYSLGCVLFEMLTGTPPFVGENALATMMKHQSEKLSSMKEASFGVDFPDFLEHLVEKMLQKNPDDRYQNLEELIEDLSQSPEKSKRTKLTDAKGLKNSDREQQKKSFFVIAALAATIVTGITAAVLIGALSKREIVATDPVKKTTDFYQTSPSAKEPELVYSDISFKTLHDKLSNPTKLGEIHFKRYKISSSVIEEISKTPWIRLLTINECELDNDGIKYLAKMPLNLINLASTNFNDDGARFLSANKNISEVNVSHTSITDKGFSALTKISKMTNFKIVGCKLSNNALFQLTKCEKLDSLDLRGVKEVDDRLIDDLTRLPLTFLSLDLTPVTSKGFRALTKISTLEKLSLNDTAVSVSDIEYLCTKSKKLNGICVTTSTNFTHEQIQKLQKKFPKIMLHEVNKIDDY